MYIDRIARFHNVYVTEMFMEGEGLKNSWERSKKIFEEDNLQVILRQKCWNLQILHKK